MKKRVNFFIAALFIVWGLLSARQARAGEIRYEGSSTIGKFIRSIEEDYKKSTFKINTFTESTGGEECQFSGSCDLGGVARAVKKEVLEKGVVATLIGKDAITIIMHPSNPVNDLSISQLRDIFTGKITNWKGVGGKDMPITVFITAEQSATHQVIKAIVLQGEKYEGKIVTPDGRIVQYVAEEPGAIGQISLSFIIDNETVKAIKVGGESATTNSIAYPITRPLNLTTMGEPQGEVKEFLGWVLSKQGQDIIKKTFVGIE